MTEIMTVREVSDYLRVHPATIYRLLKLNQIPAFRVVPTGALRLRPSTAGGRSRKQGENSCVDSVAPVESLKTALWAGRDLVPCLHRFIDGGKSNE
jgi:excisionase family DNA binding protein